MHRVAVLILPGADALDVAGPLAVFGGAGPTGTYAVDVCTSTDWPLRISGGLTVSPTRRLDSLAEADTVVVAGFSPVERPSAAVITAVRRLPERCRLLATGAGVFVLAWAGRLDGLRATTHWSLADALQRARPRVKVQADLVVARDGRVTTAAGAASTLEACLGLVEDDLGAEAARALGRSLVHLPGRTGGQGLLTEPPPRVPTSQELTDGCAWALEHLDEGIAVADLTKIVGCSARTLQRWFVDELGVTPLTWLTERRVERARTLLETTDRSIASVGAAVGLPAPSAFRATFRRLVGVSPSDYRRAYRTAG